MFLNFPSSAGWYLTNTVVGFLHFGGGGGGGGGLVQSGTVSHM